MPESIFSIVLIAFYVVIAGFILYSAFIFLKIFYDMWRISRKRKTFLENFTNETKEEKEYRLYLKSKGLKPIAKDNFDAQEHRVKKELEVCSEFIKQNSDNIYSIEKRIFLNSLLKEYQNITNDYRFLIKKIPNNFEYVSMCARYYALMQDLREALNLINNFYADKEKDDKYFNAIGDVLNAVKDYKLAIENYTKAIELNPEYHFYYIKRATAYKAMNQIDKYKEDKKKFEETVRVQKEDKINNTKLNNGILKPKKDNKNKIIFIIKLLILLSAFFAIVYFHPTKEVLNCNSRQVCKVEQTYFGLFKINKKIKLYPNSNLYCKIGAYSASKHNTYYGLYIRIDDIAPFVFYVADSVYSSYDYQIEDLEEKCNFYQQNFIKYMENYGKYQYVLDSKADTSKMLLSLIFVMLIAYVIFCSEITQLSEEIRQKKFDKKKI